MMEHTSRHYEMELVELKEKILLLGGSVEEMIGSAMRSLLDRDPELAREVIESDPKVDASELEIDHLCLNLLALRQPAASDLRFIATALKIVTDLERIGDLAVNIAERAIDLNQSPPLRPLHDLVKLAELCKKQVHRALDSFVEADADQGAAVIKDDDLVDALYHTLFNELIGLMMEDSKNIRRASSLMFVAKHLERLADHATNVAEMVIFMVKGTDVRHPHSRGLVAEK